MHDASKREACRLNTHTFHVPPCFITLNVSHPFMFHVPPCFISLHVSHPHVSRPFMFHFYVFHTFICFTSHHVLPFCTLQIHSCFISLHASNPFAFYLSPCFRSLHIYLSACFSSLHVLSLCMFHVLTSFRRLTFRAGLYSEVPDLTPSGNVCEHYRHLGRDTEQSCRQVPTFRKNTVPYTHPEDGGSTFLRNVSTYISLHVFKLSRMELIKGQSSGF